MKIELENKQFQIKLEFDVPDGWLDPNWLSIHGNVTLKIPIKITTLEVGGEADVKINKDEKTVAEALANLQNSVMEKFLLVLNKMIDARLEELRIKAKEKIALKIPNPSLTILLACCSKSTRDDICGRNTLPNTTVESGSRPNRHRGPACGPR